ncbi:MAG TPA: AMP-binding protein [Candidatus Deferrimicrobium sp.]|nr:AMP-binding protein [Candidatus Deferrimicrobium sp.]
MAHPLNLLSTLNASRSADQVIGWRNGAAVGWDAFHGRVAAWSGLLGETAGDAFALVHHDTIEFAAALFGAWLARKTVFLPGDNLPSTCAGLRANVAGFLGEFDAEWQPKAAPLWNPDHRSTRFAAIDADIVGLVLFTSGSTGDAQPIAKTLGQMAAEVAHLEKQFGALLGAADVITTVSHQHIYGLLFNVLWPLAAGRRIQARSLSWFEDLSATLAARDAVLISSPAHLSRLPENPGWAKAAQRLRAVFSSGGPLSFETAQECQRLLGRVPIEVYGSSETGGIAWRQQDRPEHQAWTALPGVEWRLDAIDANGAEDSAAEVLAVRSEHLPSKDWFCTADRARAAGDGRFFLGGRIDRIAKIEGKRISLSAIEKLLMASPLVQLARAIAVDGRRQRVAAFVVPSERGGEELGVLGRRGFTRLLRRLLDESIDPVAMPRLWRFIEALPVNPQGKTSHADLLALLEAPPVLRTEPRSRLLERDAEHALFELVAPADLIYFDGHFQGQPILAGVVQVDWAIAFGRRCFALPPRFRAIQMLKFQRLIGPDTPFRLELVYQPASATLTFKISTALGTHASGRLLFGGADD